MAANRIQRAAWRETFERLAVQLHRLRGDYGNPDLSPEESRSIVAAIGAMTQAMEHVRRAEAGQAPPTAGVLRVAGIAPAWSQPETEEPHAHTHWHADLPGGHRGEVHDHAHTHEPTSRRYGFAWSSEHHHDPAQHPAEVR